MRNTHIWKTKTESGEKREVRAEKFGKQWRVQAKLKSEERWRAPALLRDGPEG